MNIPSVDKAQDTLIQSFRDEVLRNLDLYGYFKGEFPQPSGTIVDLNDHPLQDFSEDLEEAGYKVTLDGSRVEVFPK